MIPVAIQDRTSTLQIRHVDPDTGAEITLASGTITIYDDGSSEIVPATAVTVSGSLASYSRTWPEASFELGRYRAVCSLVDGSAVTRLEDFYFEVVLRRFRRPISESDFASRYPYLTNLLPSGATLAAYLDGAWTELGNILYARLGEYPGNLLYPEQLASACELLTVSHIHRAIMMAVGTEDELKATQYRELAFQALDTALSFVRLNRDDDRNPDPREYGVFGAGELIR